ncbi:hypothetical protein F0248_10240 [Vibrio crassostreae]|uniref:hypothetical protein n=1 Tax=Vibrio crassostreae TaxID=246167 RepID=UPI000F49C49B|nr:hypothetical protein [Vibrio crassostreae]NOH74860.1 hypothetical protein [Vibrio crassostreae]NOI53457.1 hypothetical protein [Vibrio crassostreae]ROR19337.1 hypothetical protein EDB36_101481 [Vibrio crassostreae]CAK1863991.1 EF-hand domain-containing protein [Vibrio crassostreae]CAK2292541.1 EF-hand domain-containing protein [Vibrio crassostreae]
MKTYISGLLTLIPSCLIAGYAFAVSTAVVLPGQHEAGVDLSGSPLSENAVIDWEISNSDIVFGAYADKADNERATTIGYMYNQVMAMNSGWLENDLRNQAEVEGLNFEDYFLHFSEDTVIAEVDNTHGENTLLNRKPMIVGYTSGEDHAGFWLYQEPPWDADVFENFEQGGALYVYHAEQFERLTFNFSQFAGSGELWIEYPTVIDSRGMVSRWERLDIKKDRTLNMTKNQSVIWNLPNDWVRATTHDGSGASYGGGQYFGSTFLRDGGRLYVVRVRWQSENADDRPRLKEVELKNSFPTVKLTDAPSTTPDGDAISQWRKIRGFDVSADLDGDNYLSPSEYRNRTNKNATARFRWESRVVPFGRMWSANSSWSLTNVANTDYLSAIHRYYKQSWASQGLNGAYNDDTNKLIGSNQFYVHSGGHVQELGAVVGSNQADDLYKQQFSEFLKKLSALESDASIGLNIGTANLLGRNGQSHLSEAGSLYLREHYIFPSTGFSGCSGISKFWDNSALAYNGQSVIFQATTRYGRVQYLGNSEENWKQDQYSTLAIYHLNRHAQHSYFNQWNNGYVYGSGNTTADTFWQSGVPKNIAYQPSSLLAVDLGEPSHQIPQGFDPIPLMLSTTTPQLADYSIVGDASMNEMVHADLHDGMTHVLPTFTYFMYQSENQVVAGGPEDMVLAREFDKGRVLYRTDFHGKNASFYETEKLTVVLDVPMKPVDANGNIGEYVTQIEIGGYEGLFLLY